MNNRPNKLNWILMGVLGAAIPASAGAQSATFTFDTTQTSQPVYAPRNIVAVWVERTNGTFVRTLAQWAATRKQYLLAWNASSKGNNVDAVTGATFAAHGTRSVSWDLKDANKTLVPNGTYVIKMELTDHNATAVTTNNEASFNLTVGATPVNMTTSGGGFNKVQIVYTPMGSPPDLASPPVQDAGTTGGSDGGDASTGGGGSAPTGCSVTSLRAGSSDLAVCGLGLGVGLLALLRRRRWAVTA